MARGAGLLGAVLVALPFGALTQDAASAIRAWAAAPSYRESLAGAVRGDAARLGCPGARVGEPEPPVPWRPAGAPLVGPAGPAEMSWLQGVGISGCAVTDRMITLTTTVGRRADTVVVMRGRTLVDPQLHGDVIRSGLAQLGIMRIPNCTELGVVNTTVSRAPASTGAGRLTEPWEETWTVGGCGRSLRAQVTFTPDARGTGFAVRELPGAGR